MKSILHAAFVGTVSAVGSISAIGCPGCATYNYAESVQTISFSDNVKKGIPIGNLRGEDCSWSVFGYSKRGPPTIDRAFINALPTAPSDGVVSRENGADRSRDPVRYVNNVHSQNEGFNAFLFSKSCVVVTGVGYK